MEFVRTRAAWSSRADVGIAGRGFCRAEGRPTRRCVGSFFHFVFSVNFRFSSTFSRNDFRIEL